MPVGLSLHLGLNAIDPGHYGIPGTLGGCESDALSMEEIAKSQGFKTLTLLTSQATASALLSRLEEASKRLGSGDTLLLTYAGHGARVPDENGDETDGQDETWVLYDRMVLDDELYAMWRQFAPGVRIVLVSDSCHSGTVARLLEFQEIVGASKGRGVPTPQSRSLPGAVAARAIASHRDIYGPLLQQKVARRLESDDGVRAGVILLAGCLDSQLAADGEKHGKFTECLLEAWKHRPPNYASFLDAIKAKMPLYQTPCYTRVGQIPLSFEMSSPFSLVPDGTISQRSCPMLGTEPVSKNSHAPWGGRGFNGGPFGRGDSTTHPARSWEVSGGVSVGSRCVLDMDIDVNRLRDMSDQQIFAFFQGDGSQLLMQAFVQAREAAQAYSPQRPDGRGWEVSIGGKIGGRADWGVEVKGTWHF
jgi:metacaspase-1